MGKEHHHHDNHGIFGKRTELYFAILSGVFFFIGLILEKLTLFPFGISLISYVLSYIFGGYYTLLEAFEKIRNGGFEIDFLMVVAAIGAAYIGSWEEGALLLFLFSLGHALENYAMGRAKKSIEALGNLSPKVALLKKETGIEEVPIEELKIHDVIVIKPNAKIAADGVIVKGNSSINQAPVTGESMPVDKTAIQDRSKFSDFESINKEHVVYTGTLNGDNVIEVEVLKLSKDSTISRLVKMVSEIETQQSPTQRLTKKFEKWFVPAVMILVVTLCFAHWVIEETFQESLYRAIGVLVAASPCALAISTPSAVLSGVARAARSGVLVKGGRALEDLGSLTAIAFDKTGTLTEGKPKLTHAVAINYTEEEFLKLVYEVESLSNHPLAKAISNDIQSQYTLQNNNEATDVRGIQGKGISAVYKNQQVLIGNKTLMQDYGVMLSDTVEKEANRLLREGHTVMLVSFNNQLIGYVSVMDMPRKTASATLKRLKEIGIKKMIMLTGDHQNVGDSIAQQIGLTEVRGNLLPEDKVKAVQELKERETRIAMVGDGVNDAPAMANSTVGIAMGAAGSDVALETADVALMSDKIEKLPFVIELSRKSKRVIKQNLWISMGVVFLLIPIVLLGWISIGITVGIHEGSTLLVVINALRLLQYKEKTIV